MSKLTPLQRASPAFRRILFEGKISSLRPTAAITAQSSAPVRTLIGTMDQHGIGFVPLVGPDGTLEGVVSERDIVQHSMEYPALLEKAASTIMTKPVQTLPGYGSVARALYFMVAGGYRHLPITGVTLPSKSGVSTLGVVSIKNIALYLNHYLGSKITASADTTDLGDDLTQLFSAPLSSLHPQPAVTVNGSALVSEAIEMMKKHHTGSILVVGEKMTLRGIFTERDLITRILSPGLSPCGTPIEEAMTPRPHTMIAGSSLALALECFSSGKYRHLPIVDDEERLIGVLSLKDFIRALTAEVLRELGVK